MSKIVLTDEAVAPATPSAGTVLIYSAAGILQVLNSGGTPAPMISAATLTVDGDMIYRNGSGAVTRLPVGTPGDFLVATTVGADTLPVWTSVLTANGDILVRTGGVPSRLGVGTNGQVLTVTAGAPAWTTATYPATATQGNVLVASAANTWSGLANPATGAMLIHNATDPSWLALAAAPADADKLIAVNAGGTAIAVRTQNAAGSETIAHTVIMPVLGAWAVDGDGVYTNGGGLVGAVPVTTVQAAAFAVVYDQGTTTYALLSASSGMGGGGIYTNNFQFWPDAEAENDAVYFGAAIPFCEVGFSFGPGPAQPATYNATDSAVWEYYNGAAWVAIPAGTFYDNTDTTLATTGLRPFQQSGALTFLPPADWGSTTVNGQAGYWIRSRVTAGPDITQIPISSDEHALVTSEEGFRLMAGGIIDAVTINDNAATLHTTADVKFVLYDSVSGASRSVTFTMDRRRQRVDLANWTLTSAARLEVHVYQEDTAAEPTGVLLELEYGITTSNHTHSLT